MILIDRLSMIMRSLRERMGLVLLNPQTMKKGLI